MRMCLHLMYLIILYGIPLSVDVCVNPVLCNPNPDSTSQSVMCPLYRHLGISFSLFLLLTKNSISSLPVSHAHTMRLYLSISRLQEVPQRDGHKDMFFFMCVKQAAEKCQKCICKVNSFFFNI